MTATNAIGSAVAETEALAVAYPAPVVVEGMLADLGFDQGSGVQTVAAAPAFAGEGLRFAVEGAGATIDPATGEILIPTDTLRAADPVTVTASNSGGTAAASFHVTVAPAIVLPLLVAAPALAGTGVIGGEVTLDPGVWGGYPAPSLGFAWCRDGAEIPGAAGTAYTPGPEDDGAALTCRVTATNSAGSATAETAALAIAYAPPVATGELPDEVFDEDSGLQEIPTAFAFAGENLSFAVEGRGATIDAATGVVSIDTAEPMSGETVTVIAGNSGGTARASFLVTVEVARPGGRLRRRRGRVDRGARSGARHRAPDDHRRCCRDCAGGAPAEDLDLVDCPALRPQIPLRSRPVCPIRASTALKEGQTCYNSLWLYRESDGVVTRVSEDEKTFLAQAPAVPPSHSAAWPVDRRHRLPPRRPQGVGSRPGSPAAYRPETLGINASTSGTST